MLGCPLHVSASPLTPWIAPALSSITAEYLVPVVVPCSPKGKVNCIVATLPSCEVWTLKWQQSLVKHFQY